MGRTEFIGARYVPLFADPVEWNASRTYEPLTIVMHNGDSYTSRQYVPVGVDISDADFWVVTGNYNAQVAQLDEHVAELAESVADIELDVTGIHENLNYINEFINEDITVDTIYDIADSSFAIFVIRIPKAKYEVGCIGGDGSNANNRGFAYDLLKTHDYDLILNSGLSGQTELSIINEQVNVNTPSTGRYGITSAVVAYYANGDIDIYTNEPITGDELVANGVVNAYESFLPLVLDGVGYDLTPMGIYTGQKRFTGWDSDYWYEGFGFGRRAFTPNCPLSKLQTTLLEQYSHVPNWVLIDGGGSAQIYDGETKTNLVPIRDKNYPPCYARSRAIFTFYKRKEG